MAAALRAVRSGRALKGLQPGVPAAGGRVASDLSAELAGMGYSYRVAWNVSATLYGTGGLVVVALYALEPSLIPQTNVYLGCLAIGIAVLCLVCGRLLAESNPLQDPMTHARLVGGYAIYVAASLSLAGRFNAYALFPVLAILAPAFLFTWRWVVPYAIVAVASSFVGLVLSHGVAQTAHVATCTFALVMITAAILVAKERAREMSLHNRELSRTDALTGVANMRGLRERIADEVLHCDGAPRPFALFAVDLDNFKQVNDRFDHTVGDEVLCAVAAALNEQVGPEDLVARRGGDEFALFVANARERDLEALGNTLRGAIVRARLATCPQVSPSGGVAYVTADPRNEIGVTMEQVDEALHRVKAAARAARPSEPAVREARPPASMRPGDGTAEASARRGGLHGSLAGVATGANPVWLYAAFLLGVSSLLIASISLPGLVEPLGPATGGSAALTLMLLAAFCIWADRSHLPARWLLVPWMAALALTVAAIAVAGRSGTAVVDLLAVYVLYGCLMFRTRTAALYLALGLACFGTLAIAGGYPQGALRTVVTAIVVVVTGGLAVRLRDLTDRLARKHRELSELDPLTGVANLRGLHSRLYETLRLGHQQRHRPLVLAIDLDGFKQVNDLHSHTTGDRMLTAVAHAISNCARSEDLVARRGGDEFYLVIEDADPTTTASMVSRIESAIATARRRICPALCPTAAVACVAWRPGESRDELLHSADRALHEKKALARRSSAPLAESA